MGKVLFTIQYEILVDKREDYLDVVRELKSLVKTEGLESYSVFELKGKANVFTEVYVFENDKAFEDFDDDQDERVDILMNKLADMIKEHSTQYSTLFEV
jgi:L-rhamnose mutarotase